MMPYTEVLFTPGSKYSYSNPGVIFLGRIIEKLSGDDYEVYVDKNILKPLEMYRTYFDITPRHLLKYRSNNYYVEKDASGRLQVKANGRDFISSYNNVVLWRNDFVHAARLPTTATFNEVMRSYEDGKEVIRCLNLAMDR